MGTLAPLLIECRYIRLKQPVGHPLLEMPNDMRLGPRDRDRHHVTFGSPEFDHIGAIVLGAIIMIRFLPVIARATTAIGAQQSRRAWQRGGRTAIEATAPRSSPPALSALVGPRRKPRPTAILDDSRVLPQRDGRSRPRSTAAR